MSKKKNSFLVWGWDRNTVPRMTVCHYSASLMMANGDPMESCFFPSHALALNGCLWVSSGAGLYRFLIFALFRILWFEKQYFHIVQDTWDYLVHVGTLYAQLDIYWRTERQVSYCRQRGKGEIPRMSDKFADEVCFCSWYI